MDQDSFYVYVMDMVVAATNAKQNLELNSKKTEAKRLR